MSEVVRFRSGAWVDGEYRYTLWRQWAPGNVVAWIMLNPSTADATLDDPTIRRVIGFSREWGYAGCHVVNLFALRTTNPRRLVEHPSPIGPNNDDVLRAAMEFPLVVAAWGAHPMAAVRAAGLLAEYPNGRPSTLRALGTTRSGAPRHPLYVPGRAQPRPWPETVKRGSPS